MSLESVEGFVTAATKPTQDRKLSHSLDEMIARRVEFLTAYQNAAYARRYRELVEKMRAAEAKSCPARPRSTEAVARYYFKLIAYKDEYEVARLYTSGAFQKQVEASFEGDKLRYTFHLAPPILGRKDGPRGCRKRRASGRG